MTYDALAARNLAKYGMRRGAYNGALRRRFVLFVALNNGNERRHEFDRKGDRDAYALRLLEEKKTEILFRSVEMA